MRLIDENGLANVEYAEPYAGGAAVALSLLLEEYASVVHINDLSRPVYAFWHSVLNHNADLCKRIARVRLSMREWERQRAVYDARESADLADLGFAAFFLNRSNRSGIIAGGVIGGKDQTGEWGIDARFAKDELIRRIKQVGRFGSRIRLYQMDALKFTNSIVPSLGVNAFVFYDPPYIENGRNLYLNDYTLDGHRKLSARILKLKCSWVVTYDPAAITSKLYPSQRRMVYGLSYSANSRQTGREVMFLADRLRLPSLWQTKKRIVMSHPRSKFPVYGRMENMKPQPEMEEGPAALERFRKVVRSVVSTPKSSVTKRKRAAKKKTTRGKS